jgi:hypothetical protein
MFDLKYYNKTLHKLEFEQFIKKKGLIPIEDLSPIYGICYNKHTINKVNKLLNIDKNYINKILFWKLLNEINEEIIIKNIYSNNSYIKSENKDLLKIINNFKNNFHDYKHSNFAYIQLNDKIAYPFDISYNTKKINLNKILDNDIECSVCLDIDNNRYTCQNCCTIICTECHKNINSLCPICNNKIILDDFI